MAQNAPKSIEIEQIQFKLHTKANIFDAVNNQLKSNVNLLATSSNCGLVFVGDPNKRQLKAVPLQSVLIAKNLSGKLLCREVALPNTPDNIAISCDGSLLAVNYTLQNICFLSIYSVPSFLTPNIITKFANIPLANENNVTVTQILWNPVISNTLAIILNNGALLMYNLKETNYEFFSLDKAEQVKCASWSPKGKQIVVGFPGGKLVQFKPDLKPARIIACPDNIHDGPFDTIAVQWLSTYQFAAAFLQHGEDFTPCLYIINAPKVGNPTYINYYDICFSGSGPRIGQIFLIHIQAWNLLIVASANSMEMGILGTTEINETPNWFEYTMSDDSVRLALPMTADKEETYPIGISLDTGITHQLIMNENQLPIMPMVHLLSTHGQLVSFDLLNLSPNTPGICSPPQLAVGQSELSYFKPFESTSIQKPPQQDQSRTQPITTQQPVHTDSSFMDNFGAATSTPTSKGKPKQFFGDPSVTTSNTLSFATLNNPAATSGNLFGVVPQQNITPPTSQLPGLEKLPALNFFGGVPQQQSMPTKPTGQLLFGGQNSTTPFNLPSSTTVQSVPPIIPKTVITEAITTKSENPEKNKPLYTIPPTFKPPIDNKSISQSALSQYKEKSEKNINFNDAITLNVIQEMIAIEVNSFQLELNELSKKSKSVDISIGNIEESKNCTKRLDDLRVINEQAEETIFETDVQVLRHSVNECFSMIAEAKSKLELFENPEMFNLGKISGCDQSNRRKLAKLNSFVATNHVQLKMIQQQIDSNWSAYQDLVHQNSKVRMHIPSLEGIYQTLTKQKDILATQRKKLSYIKSKLNIRNLIGDNKRLASGNNINITVDSLADSILSMSLSEHVKRENSRLSLDKIQAIRDTLKGRKIIIVKPHRPERMKSEVILECKLRTERKRDGAVTKPEKMMFQSRIENQPQQEPVILTKPAATKPIASKPMFSESFKTEQPKLDQQQPKLSMNFSGQGSVPFGMVGKPQSTTTDKNKSAQTSIPLLNPETTKKNSSTTFTSGAIPNVTGGLFGANQNTSNFFGSKQSPSKLFTGNTTEKSAFAIPSAFSGVDVKNDNINSSSFPTFNIGANPFPVHTAPLEKQSSNTEINNVFAPLTGSNSAPTFSGFNLGSKAPKNPIFDTFVGAKPTVTNSALSKIPATSTSTTKDTADDILENLNICKPTAKVPDNSKADNIFSLPSTTAPKTSFVDLGSASLANTESIKSTFAGFGSTTTPTDSSKTTPAELSATDAPKPLFSGFGISTTTDTQNSNKISFGGFTSNTNTAEASKIPFSGFGIPISSDPPKTTGFTGFGATNADPSKPLFGGFAASVTTTSSEVTKTPFSGFGTSTTSSETAKTQFTGFGPAVTTTTTEQSKNLFSGFGAPVTTSTTDPIKSPFNTLTSATTTTPTTDALKINFAALGTTITVTSSDNKLQMFGVQSSPVQTGTSVTAATTTATPPSTISSSTFGALNLKQSSAPAFGTSTLPLDTTTAIASISDTTATQVPQTTSQESIFSVAAPAAAATTEFGAFKSGGSSSIFGGTTAATDTQSTTASFGFGSLAVTTTSAPSIFAAAAANISPFAPSPVSSTTSIFGTTPTATPNNIFGGASAATTGGSIFGGIPKPDQSVFSNQTSPFGAQPNSGGSIFGTSNTSTNQPTSPFGQQTSPFQSSGTSIFGGQKTESTNIFGASNQQSTGGSIFGQQASSPFGINQDPSQTSIFGTATTETTGFSGGSIFGGTSQNTNSPFGGAAQAQTSGFGAGPFSAGPSTGGAFSGFGTTSPAGAFAQGGPSISQTGFGSPNSSFSKPPGVFGGGPAFGSPPSFGNSPSFGGPPTFGGFGSTQTTGGTSPTAFSPTTQKNNLFEALGSSGDNISSFGNLAQSANQNTSKPAFPGGSSFSSWR